MDTVDWLSQEYGSPLCQRDNRKGRESRAWKLINHKREEIREKTGLNREEDDHSGVKRDGLESQLLIDTLFLEGYCRRLFLDVDVLLFYFVHEMVLGCQVWGSVRVHSLKEKWLMIGIMLVVDRPLMCYRTCWRSSTLMTFPNSNIAKSSAWRRFYNRTMSLERKAWLSCFWTFLQKSIEAIELHSYLSSNGKNRPILSLGQLCLY